MYAICVHLSLYSYFSFRNALSLICVYVRHMIPFKGFKKTEGQLPLRDNTKTAVHSVEKGTINH